MNELLLHILFTLCKMQQKECLLNTIEHTSLRVKDCFTQHDACMEPYEKFRVSKLYKSDTLPQMDADGYVICSDVPRSLKIVDCAADGEKVVPKWQTQPVSKTTQTQKGYAILESCPPETDLPCKFIEKK